MAEISIIVPIYNSIRYLEQCIDSIIAQLFRDIEIILVDDGSYDGSERICDSYAVSDSRVKVLHKVNGGLVSARKAGFKVASGKWIGFVDSDDWIEPDMYSKLFNCAITNEVEIAMCGRYEDLNGYRRPVYQGIEAGVYRGEELKASIFPKMIVNEAFFEWGIFPSYWDKLFRKEKLEKYIYAVDDRITMGEDAACIYPCIYNSESIYVLKECLYHYRQSAGSMVKKVVTDIETEREKYRILYQTTRKQLCEDCGFYGLEEQWKKYLLFLMIPRADILYKKIDSLDYLFPFPKVKKGNKIAIYGAGLWGKRLYDYLKENGFCEVVAIADRNYMNIRKKDFDVIAPDRIMDFGFDSIVVAASFAITRNVIINDLRKKYPKTNIYGLDENEVFSDKTLAAFGLL